jgi:hypothetical protein
MADPVKNESSTIMSTPEAKNTGASGKTSQNNKVLVSSPFMELLIGGPYTKNGKEHRYGHAALRVFINKNREFVYDYGRYGETWGLANSKGEGILRVWTSSKHYITNENALGRTTEGFLYYLEPNQAEAIVSFFDGKISKLKSRDEKKDPKTKSIVMKSYKIAENYHAVSSNCTTTSISGTKKSGKNILYKPSEYREFRGLNFVERQLAKIQTYPEYGIFMPFDVQAMLEGAKTNVKEGGAISVYDKKITYRKKP